MRFQGAHQRAGFAFWAQVGVYLEKCGRADAVELSGQARGFVAGGFGNKNDIHVGDVVQLLRAALAHRDHR